MEDLTEGFKRLYVNESKIKFESFKLIQDTLSDDLHELFIQKGTPNFRYANEADFGSPKAEVDVAKKWLLNDFEAAVNFHVSELPQKLTRNINYNKL